MDKGQKEKEKRVLNCKVREMRLDEDEPLVWIDERAKAR